MSYTTKLKSIIDELSKGLLEREEAVKLILLVFQVNLYFYMDL